MDEFAKAMKKVAEAFADFNGALFQTLLSDPATRRRWQRDLARMNSRPSLIHKGGKP